MVVNCAIGDASGRRRYQESALIWQLDGLRLIRCPLGWHAVMSKSPKRGASGAAIVALVLLIALGAFAGRPQRAQAFSFICPYLDYLEAAYPGPNNPAPPNGVNECHGKVNDKAPPGPGPGEEEDI